ncbi:response regulator, partial [Vibrio parahaemolyticus V-223/04]
PRQGDMKERA